ncbi:hypothetical protein HCH_00377 [Hahella chejuensis KCTC 2396]|uniref:Phage tail assembly chaperone-like domain-containing protein n=1 Tax=Hahella chejuensis (strain KCTC 2396) TaxID=349521 RepID=Q2SPY6_HAHCH|nr:phage tail assembly chaperone [Hahella chejuensis]ABC27288.1 hypothetical protein HCH_00377 [Hahella chejuensis KCTC 2396]
MKRYIENQFGEFICQATTYPRRHRRQILAEVDGGKATLIPFDHDAAALAAQMSAERAWRDAELKRADIELFKVEDRDSDGQAQRWRAYRCALRDYPQQADFPQCVRPSAPDRS